MVFMAPNTAYANPRQQSTPKGQLPRVCEIIHQASEAGLGKSEMLGLFQAEGIEMFVFFPPHHVTREVQLLIWLKSRNGRQLRYRLSKQIPGQNRRQTCQLKPFLTPKVVEVIRKIEYALACTDNTTAFNESARLLQEWLKTPKMPVKAHLMLFTYCCRSARTQEELQQSQELLGQMRPKINDNGRDKKLFEVLLEDQLEIVSKGDSNLQDSSPEDDDRLAACEEPYTLELNAFHCNLSLLLLLTRAHTLRNFRKGKEFHQNAEERLRESYLGRSPLSTLSKRTSDAIQAECLCIFECLYWLKRVLKAGKVRDLPKLNSSELQYLGNRELLFRAFSLTVTRHQQDPEDEYNPGWINQTRHQLCISPADVLFTFSYMLCADDNPSQIPPSANAASLFAWAQQSLDWLQHLGRKHVLSRFIHHFIDNNKFHVQRVPPGGGPNRVQQSAHRALWKSAIGTMLTQDSEPKDRPLTPSPVDDAFSGGVPRTPMASAAEPIGVLPEAVNPLDTLISPTLDGLAQIPADLSDPSDWFCFPDE